jgi:hypothetical protein
MSFLMDFAFGAVLGVTITYFTGLTIFDLHFWLTFLPIAIVYSLTKALLKS